MNHSEAGKIGAEKVKLIIAAKHDAFVAAYYKEPKKCKQCQEVIVFESRYNDYCNHSCATKHSNLLRGKQSREEVLPHACNFCGCITTNLLFCSSKCVNEAKHKIFIEAWLSGEQNVSTCHGLQVSSHVKKWLRSQYGDKCQECGWCKRNIVTGRVPLQLDHKDGNSQNNDPSNLRLLCPNCHSLTPTFGGLNRGRGRKLRYKKI